MLSVADNLVSFCGEDSVLREFKCWTFEVNFHYKDGIVSNETSALELSPSKFSTANMSTSETSLAPIVNIASTTMITPVTYSNLCSSISKSLTKVLYPQHHTSIKDYSSTNVTSEGSAKAVLPQHQQAMTLPARLQQAKALPPSL